MRSRIRDRGRHIAGFGLFLTALAVIAASWMAQPASGGWRMFHGTGTRPDGDTVEADIWLRDLNAVVITRSGGVVQSEAHCQDGQLIERYPEGATILRTYTDRRECLRHATNGYLLLTEGSPTGFELVARGEDLVTYRRAEGAQIEVTSLVIAGSTGLILEATYEGGASLRMQYEAPVSEEPPPWPKETPTEIYRDLAPGDVAPVLSLESVPNPLAGLTLTHTFSYEATSLNGPTYYAIWSGPDRQVQLVSTLRVSKPDELGYSTSAGPSVLALQEGPRFVQIYATDEALMREAVAQLRPSALANIP